MNAGRWHETVEQLEAGTLSPDEEELLVRQLPEAIRSADKAALVPLRKIVRLVGATERLRRHLARTETLTQVFDALEADEEALMSSRLSVPNANLLTRLRGTQLKAMESYLPANVLFVAKRGA